MPQLASRSLLRFVIFSRLRFRLLVMILSLLAAVMSLFSPYFQKVFIDRILSNRDSSTALENSLFPDWPVLTFIVIAFSSALLAHLFNLLAVYFATREGMELQKRLSEWMYERMLNLRTDTLMQLPVGEVVSIYASDVTGANILLEQCLPQLFSIFFPVVLAPLAMRYLYHLPLSLTIISMALVMVLNTLLASRQSRFFYKFKTLAAERTAMVNEWIQNMRTLKVLGWIPSFEHKIFRKRVEETTNRVAMVTNGQFMNSVASSVTYAITITGLYSLIILRQSQVSPGELMALLWIFGIFLTRAFRQMPWFFTLTLDGLSSIQRIEKFLNMQDLGGAFRPSLTSSPQEQQELPKAQTLKVENLNLSIDQTPILHNISLSVAEGEFVAIVGEVGSGKSLLLLSLIGETGARFDRYQIGGEDALTLSPAELRSHFGYVPQEGFVMSASLRENVAFAYDVSQDRDPEIQSCLLAAQFNPLFEVRSEGLQTETGERGVSLSGGQRQRISLARACYQNRPIFLLDDCLSAVDVDTERGLIRDLIMGRWRDATRLLVTHRLSILSLADRVILLDKGKIVADGTFASLAENSAAFREFAASVLEPKEELRKAQSGGGE